MKSIGFNVPKKGMVPDTIGSGCMSGMITSGGVFTDMRANIDKPPGDVPSKT
jgi:hypothetical protein